MTYDAIIFDSDGVLVRPTARSHVEEGIRTTLSAFGLVDPDTTQVEALSAGTSMEALEAIARAHDLDLAEVWEHRDETVSKVQRDLVSSGEKHLYDDVAETLEELARNYRLGVVSNNQAATVSFVLEQGDIRGYFDVVYGRPHSLEGFRRTKPDPYYINEAIRELNADNALYIGDSETDIEAAERAGIDVVFLRRAHTEDPEAKPTYLVHSLSELPALLEK